MRAGDVFRFRHGDDHLWMVISDPTIDDSLVLLVNLTSWRADKDQSCRLNPGDHPAVHHNSVIYYDGSRVHSDAHLNWLLNSGKIVLDVPLSPELLQRIREGAGDSSRMKLAHGKILIDQGLISE